MTCNLLQDKRHILVINVPLQFFKDPSYIRMKIDTNLLRVNTFFIQCQATFIIPTEQRRKKKENFQRSRKDIVIDDWQYI